MFDHLVKILHDSSILCGQSKRTRKLIQILQNRRFQYRYMNQNCWQILEAILRQTKHAVIILIMYGRRAEVAGAEANFRLVCITAPYPGLVGKYGHKVTEKCKFCNII